MGDSARSCHVRQLSGLMCSAELTIDNYFFVILVPKNMYLVTHVMNNILRHLKWFGRPPGPILAFTKKQSLHYECAMVIFFCWKLRDLTSHFQCLKYHSLHVQPSATILCTKVLKNKPNIRAHSTVSLALQISHNSCPIWENDSSWYSAWYLTHSCQISVSPWEETLNISFLAHDLFDLKPYRLCHGYKNY